MSSYESLVEESKRKLTEYYLKCIQETEKRFESQGGKIKGTAIYPKEKKHGVKDILEASKIWGIPVTLDLPIERVDFDVEKPVLSGFENVPNVSSPAVRPSFPCVHAFFDKKSAEPEPKTWWEKTQRWFKKKWNKLRRKKTPGTPNGVVHDVDLSFDELLDNLHTRKVKHALNNMLSLAGIPEESLDEFQERNAAKCGKKLPYKKDREENRFKLTWTQRKVEWFIRKKNAAKRGFSQLWNTLRRG